MFGYEPKGRGFESLMVRQKNEDGFLHPRFFVSHEGTEKPTSKPQAWKQVRIPSSPLKPYPIGYGAFLLPMRVQRNPPPSLYYYTEHIDKITYKPAKATEQTNIGIFPFSFDIILSVRTTQRRNKKCMQSKQSISSKGIKL